MLENLSNTITEITAFTNEHRIDAQFFLHKVKELCDGSDAQNSRWARFEKRSGVYCILSANEVDIRYIGMSQRDTGGRVFPWIFSKKTETEQDMKTADPEDVVLSIVMEKQPYMAPALESFLIAKLKPRINQMP